MSDEQTRLGAIEYAKKNKKEIARRLVDMSLYPPEDLPVSVFMAGSPGAGKTESSKKLIEDKKGVDGKGILRIDPDDIREEFRSLWYNGKNSNLFQYPTSIIADKMQDLALHQSQSYIFDGTLANLERSRENIKRSLHHSRIVLVLYVYQEPLQAWKFVKARERKDGRVIPPRAFVDEYFGARQNIAILKEEFKNQIQIDILIKNIDGSDYDYHENIPSIDRYIKEKYNTDSLLNAIMSQPI